MFIIYTNGLFLKIQPFSTTKEKQQYVTFCPNLYMASDIITKISQDIFFRGLKKNDSLKSWQYYKIDVEFGSIIGIETYLKSRLESSLRWEKND